METGFEFTNGFNTSKLPDSITLKAHLFTALSGDIQQAVGVIRCDGGGIFFTNKKQILTAADNYHLPSIKIYNNGNSSDNQYYPNSYLYDTRPNRPNIWEGDWLDGGSKVNKK